MTVLEVIEKIDFIDAFLEDIDRGTFGRNLEDGNDYVVKLEMILLEYKDMLKSMKVKE